MRKEGEEIARIKKGGRGPSLMLIDCLSSLPPPHFNCVCLFLFLLLFLYHFDFPPNATSIMPTPHLSDTVMSENERWRETKMGGEKRAMNTRMGVGVRRRTTFSLTSPFHLPHTYARIMLCVWCWRMRDLNIVMQLRPFHMLVFICVHTFYFLSYLQHYCTLFRFAPPFVIISNYANKITFSQAWLLSVHISLFRPH
mmetsp:Transcript_19219/g.49233  ORF Transcript_19219/g.49233 Transcript_19219/m.49233 type:complete len:197 (-) Transcript_19219:1495-2085(-)